MKKMKNFSKFWHDDTEMKGFELLPDIFDYSEIDSIKLFENTHPAVYHKRIAKQNWKIELDPAKKKLSFIKWFLYRFEKLTGVRLFDYQNYKII